MPPHTSIALCTYNGARFLEPQWDSLVAQSCRPDEIVVRDDASTDGTLALLDRLRARAEARGIKVDIASHARNVGYLANFAAALQATTGEIVFLCDQDDVWRPDKLATLRAEFARRPRLLLLCSDARRVDAAGVDLGRTLFQVLRITPAELRRIHAGQGFEVLLRRSLATGATVGLRRLLLDVALPFPAGWVHDEWLAIIAAALGGFDCVEQPLIDYRQHGDNQIGMPERGLEAVWRDLVRPRAALLDMLIRREDALALRLSALDTLVPDGHRIQLADKRHYLQARKSVHGAPWSRLRMVFRTAACGHYARYGSGWRSLLRDLLRRG